MIGIGAWARATPDAPALLTTSGDLPFGELDLRQRRLAGFLQRSGMGPGDRVAVLAWNRPEVIEIVGGALRAGMIPVPVNPRLTRPEVAYILEDTGTSLLFTDHDIEALPHVSHVVTLGDAYERCLGDAEPADISDVVLTRPMHYTSGTTGVPKGVYVPALTDTEAAQVSTDFRDLWSLQPDDVHLVCSPLAHSAPLRFSLRTLETGGSVVVQRRFEAAETLAAVELFGVTTTFMVPTHLERILHLGRVVHARHDLSSLRLVAHAGAPIREETKRAAIALFPPGAVWEFYGSTEGQATRISSAEWTERPGSVGRPLPGVTIRITDEDGEGLPAQEVGVVWVSTSGSDAFTYWGDRAKTRAAWSGDSFTVGDLGWLDTDGYLYLTGRSNDVIITGGVNVYPQEVEAVLASHPSVLEAMVVGLPDEEWGQVVRAQIVLDPESEVTVDESDLRAWARERLAGYKIPRAIAFVDELPKTATGKLRRTVASDPD